MKQISKIFSVVLSVLTVLSCSTFVAMAATSEPAKKVISCDISKCKNVQDIISKLKNNKIDLNCFLKENKGYCPDGNCIVTNQHVTSSAKSVDKPVKTDSKSYTAPVNESDYNIGFEGEVLSLVNKERVKAGLQELSYDNGATNVAHLRAKEISQTFSHTRPDGRSCFTAATDSGVKYNSAGENIAFGYSTPEDVVKGWMNSEGHRKNILSSSFNKIGIGCYSKGGVLYWSQFFIG